MSQDNLTPQEEANQLAASAKRKTPAEIGLKPLLEYSQQPLFVGTTPHFLFDTAGKSVDRGLVDLSTQLRNAQAQERIATAMEQANELLAIGRQQLTVGATLGEGPTKTVLNAHMVKGATHIDIQMDFTNPVKAATFFDDFMVHLKRMVDEAEEGGQPNG